MLPNAESAARRKRLRAATNRLSLIRATVAQSDRGRCAFCDCAIIAGQAYKRSGTLAAHTCCLAAVTDMLREKEAKANAPVAKPRVWHVIAEADKARISCMKCGRPADVCEHEETKISVSFWYYCMEHGLAKGYKPVAK